MLPEYKVIVFIDMTFRDIFNEYKHALANLTDFREAENVFFLVNEYLTGRSRAQYLMHSELIPDDEIQTRFFQCLERLKTNEPVQYVLNEAWFYGRAFYVDHHVLIPRSETEELIQIVQNKVSEKSVVLDVGTGSGCIAITIALECQCPVFAVDISHDAIGVAVHNANKLGAQVGFFVDDVLSMVDLPSEKFDVIVSNPPYVLENERDVMRANVLDYEPEQALFVPDCDPLLFYKAIARLAGRYLNVNGWLIFEINEKFGRETADLLIQGYTKVEIIKDLHGKNRFVIAQKK